MRSVIAGCIVLVASASAYKYGVKKGYRLGEEHERSLFKDAPDMALPPGPAVAATPAVEKKPALPALPTAAPAPSDAAAPEKKPVAPVVPAELKAPKALNSGWFAKSYRQTLRARILIDSHDAGAALKVLSAAEQTIPRGGVLTVDPVGDGETMSFRVTATGLNARVPQNIADMVAGQSHAADAHAVQPYYTRLLAEACGLKVKLAAEGEAVVATAS